MPPKKIIKKPEQILQHPFLHESLTDDPKAKLYIKKKMTPEEYSDLISGTYGHSWYNLPDDLEEHPHNTPQNNDKAVKKLLSRIQSAPEEVEDNSGQLNKEHYEKLMNNLFSKHHPSAKALSHYIRNQGKYGAAMSGTPADNIKGNPNLNSDHINQLMEEEQDTTPLINHPAFNKEHATALLTNPNKISRLNGPDVLNLINRQKHADPSHHLLDESQIEQLARKAGTSSRGGDKSFNDKTLDHVLEHLPPEKRTKILDDMLGITEGHSGHDPDDGEDPGYDNWIPDGEDYSGANAEVAAGSKYLSPHQADHIKRHGDFDAKYQLFNNPDVDVKHAQEMYSHWLNDDSDKGYNLDDLKERLGKDHPYEDQYEHFNEDAREQAQEDYPISDYLGNLDDNEIMGEHKDDWISNRLGEMDESEPGYDKSKQDAEKEWDESVAKAREGDLDNLDDNQRDQLWQDYDESLSDDIHDRSHDLYNEAKDKFHEDYDYLPKHLKDKLPSVEEIKRQRAEEAEVEARQKAAEEEKKVSTHLDAQVPNRDNVHPYGELQHHIELAKDHADANGGQIDIGSLNRLYPNLKDKWKQIFDGKGKISSQELEAKHQEVPKTKYDISYGKWDKGLQNINERPQTIVRLDHSPESIAPIKADEKTHETFRKIQDVSQRSGHPTNANTIGWARVDTSDPKHWMIDETQSDFASGARDYLKGHGKEDEAQEVDKIIAHHKNWREALTNKVIDLARKNGVEKVSTHSPESKAIHTGADKVHSVYKDSYQKVPRSMGFQPVPGESLPLSDEGKKTFGEAKKEDTAGRMQDHKEGMDYHSLMAVAHSNLAAPHGAKTPILGRDEEYLADPEEAKLHADSALAHRQKWKAHRDALLQIDPTLARSMPNNPYAHNQHIIDRTKDAEAGAKRNNTGNMMAYQDIQSRKAGDLVGIPVPGYDNALSEAAKPVQMQQGHTYNLKPEAVKKTMLEVFDLMKSELDSSMRNKIAMTLKTLQDNKEMIDQMQQANPQAYEALSQLIQAMVEIFKHKTGEDPQNLVHQLEIQQELEEQQAQAEQSGQQPPQEGQEQSQGPGHLASKDQPIHGHQMVYAPGSIRRYSSQDARIKDPATGDWKSLGGGVQEPDPGQQDG